MSCEDIIIEVPTEVITIEMTPEGKDGQDGFSPIAAVSKSGKTATITITDKTGTTTASVTDGEDGQPGPPGTTTWEGITDKPESFPPSAHTHTVTDITDFPTLGTMSAESASDYYTKSATDALLTAKASIIRTSSSGSLVHITDAAAMPVDALTVGIEPVQSGSGTPAPDNVCPISGHATATVTRTGKNLFVSGWEQGSINASGNNVNDNSTVRTADYIPVIPNQEYSMTRTIATSYNNVRCYNKEKTYLGSGSDYIVAISGGGSNSNPMGANQTYCVFKAKEPVAFIRFNDVSNNLATNYMMVAGNVSASQVGDYVAPVIQTVTINLNGTYYGATVDALTGVMTVTWKLQTLDANIPISNDGYRNLVERTNCYTVEYGGYRSDGLGGARCYIYSDKFASDDTTSLTNFLPYCITNATSDPRLYLSLPKDYNTLEKVQTWFGNNPTQVVYPLAEPFTIQLTPAELSLLFGTNNVWASTGDVNVGYRADTKLFIERKIAELQALILDN